MSRLHKKWHTALLTCSLEELRALDQLIQKRITELAHNEPPENPAREVVERQQSKSGGYLQLEKVRCGKAGCKCTRGELHGPYWYAYQKKGGRTVSTYIGKTKQ